VTDKDLALLPDAQDPKRRGLTSFWPTGKNWNYKTRHGLVLE
jgi:hypothetical protein